MDKEILFFIIAFALPHLYYRALFFTVSKIFDKPFLREKTGLKIHHIHYGMVLSLIASVVILLSEKNIYVTTFLGFGLGFMFDEFIPALLMKSKRSDEMIAYRKSFKPTLILIIFIAILILILSLL